MQSRGKKSLHNPGQPILCCLRYSFPHYISAYEDPSYALATTGTYDSNADQDYELATPGFGPATEDSDYDLATPTDYDTVNVRFEPEYATASVSAEPAYALATRSADAAYGSALQFKSRGPGFVPGVLMSRKVDIHIITALDFRAHLQSGQSSRRGKRRCG